MMKRLAVLAATAVAATSMSACSFNASFGTDVKGSTVEKKILPELKKQTGDDSASVSCPGELKSKEGSRLTCTGTVKGQTYPIDVESTGGGKFSWKLDSTVPSSDPSEEESPEPTAAPTTKTSSKPSPKPSSSPKPTSSANPSSGSLRVAAIKVENEISDMLKAQTGKNGVAECPDDLEGRVGATLTCTLTVVEGEDVNRPVLVTVTAVEGSDVRFSMKVQ
ncbi:hypothetical protein GCM10027418_30060 [Mariniluteicoccus endophyticus]